MAPLPGVVLGLLLAAADAGSAAGTAPGPPAGDALRPLSAREYARLMRLLGDRLTAELRLWARSDLQRREDAATALAELAPQGTRFRAALQEIAAKLEISGAQVAAFVTAHPDIAEREANALGRRIDAENKRLAPALAAARRRWAAAPGAQVAPAAPPRAGEPAPSSWWQQVRGPAELEVLLGKEQRLLLVFRAEWCIPCRELDRNVFTRADVRARLAGYTRVSIDVTDDESPETKRMIDAFGASRLPLVLVYARSGPLREFLRSKAPRPEPTVMFDQLVSAEEFLARLPR
jgi:hypothetical protein